MTKTNCDICKEEIETGYGHGTKEFSLAGLLHRNSECGGAIETLEFTFKVKVESFHFSCTNFHVCDKCLFRAFVKGMNKESELIRIDI